MTQTLEELRKEHMQLKHEAVPAFGCPSCIQARDAFWMCDCVDGFDMNDVSVKQCGDCGKWAPERVLELCLVPNTTPIKAESNR